MLAGRVDFSLPIFWLTKVNPTYECNFLDKKCKYADILVTQIGHFGHFNYNLFPALINRQKLDYLGRNETKHFRPNVLLKGISGSHPYYHNNRIKNREEGIRTPGGIAPTQPFQDCTLSRSDTSLYILNYLLNAVTRQVLNIHSRHILLSYMPYLFLHP